MIIYRATGRNYYCRFVRQRDGLPWNDDMGGMDDRSADWSECAVAMTESPPGTGQYPIESPEDLPAGIIYDAIVYRRTGAVAANTDTVDSGYELKRGSIFGF